MTNRQAVSKVINSLRELSVDNRISRRYVLSILRDVSKGLIAQKNLDRTIDLDTNLISEVTCFEFTKIDSINCPIASFRRCDILMKSKHKLPELIFSRLGSSIKEITSVDETFRIKVTSLESYRRDQSRKYKIKNEVFAYIDSEGYVFIPDTEIHMANVKFITMKTEDVAAVSSCKEESCLSGYDYNFIVPDKLESAVFNEAIRIIIGTYKQIRPDVNPNGIEGN